MPKRFLILLAVTALLALPQSQEPPAHQKLIPTLWVQSAVEWQASCRQTYLSARGALDEALRDSRWTAEISPSSLDPVRLATLPPSVVLDIDETLLDNSPGQARQVKAGSGFDHKLWNQWVSESKAQPIPGALDFCRYAASRGVTLFYISNRDAAHESATRTNLRGLGFPLPDGLDTVLLRGERPEWTSENNTRRAHVAQTHRVLLLIGDDLGDFLHGARTTAAARRQLIAPYTQFWGRKWFILPNPSYGSWEDALFTPTIPTDLNEQLRRKLTVLDTAQP